MSKPDDGGPTYQMPGDLFYPQYSGKAIPGGGASVRLVLAAQFAAAWLPVLRDRNTICPLDELLKDATAWGLAQADDLLRRLKETQT